MPRELTFQQLSALEVLNQANEQVSLIAQNLGKLSTSDKEKMLRARHLAYEAFSLMREAVADTSPAPPH